MGTTEDKENENKVLEAAKKRLLAGLRKEYGDIPLVTLSDLARDVKVIPSVRSGDEALRNNNDYYEVSPTRLNHYDELLIEDKELGLANNRLLNKYKLSHGDLIVSYRGYRQVLIGRYITANSLKPVVAAVSNIRISFSKEESESFSLLVQQYLTSSLAQSYLRARTHHTQKATPNRRYTLNRSYLAAIPIPDFREILKENSLDPLYYIHKDIVASTQELKLMMDTLNERAQEENEKILSTFFHENHSLSQQHQHQVTQLQQLKLLQKQATLFLSPEEYEAYKKKLA